ncbi:helix-turn-helix domain-containing protein [Kribbella swartbergensis]
MGERAFGELLRRFRGEAELTQAALAERSGVGMEAIRSLETGRRRSPRPETVRLLADALGLAGAERATFCTAATQVPRELPADVQDFTGRAAEVRRLLQALKSPGVTVVTGPAGSGKTALAVHAARQVHFPGGELFVNLRGSTGRVAAGPGTLLVLDDATDAEQVPRATDATVIVTSREPFGQVAADNHIALTGLPTPDALRLLQRISGADRWRRDPAGTLEVIELCEGLPAALRRAAARLVGRPSWSPADLAGWLNAQRRRLVGAP